MPSQEPLHEGPRPAPPPAPAARSAVPWSPASPHWHVMTQDGRWNAAADLLTALRTAAVARKPSGMMIVAPHVAADDDITGPLAAAAASLSTVATRATTENTTDDMLRDLRIATAASPDHRNDVAHLTTSAHRPAEPPPPSNAEQVLARLDNLLGELPATVAIRHAMNVAKHMVRLGHDLKALAEFNPEDDAGDAPPSPN